MLKNYIKIAWRNLRKHKLYSIINISGLAVGVTCSLLIFLYVSNELSYDNFHANGKNIYRASREGKIGENEFSLAFTPAPLAAALKEEVPEVTQAVRLRVNGSFLVKRPDMERGFKEGKMFFADSGFFDLFTFPLLQGNPQKQFTEPNMIAISRKAAEMYFPNENPLNQSLILDGDETYIVTGVFEDFPNNSHFQADFLMSMQNIDFSKRTSFTSNNFYTYYAIREGADPSLVNEKINQVVDTHMAPEILRFIGKSLDELKSSGNFYIVESQPLQDIYLNSNYTIDIGLMGNRTYVILFSCIAGFIIILASINFMNLSTARSANRSKEVGIRKALGSRKSSLIKQFLVESLMVSMIAFLIGIFLVILLLPSFNSLTGKDLALPSWNIWFIFLFALCSLAVGILAGIYPAFYLSSFQPVETLKGKVSLGTGNALIRSGLVVFQFFISILLIIGTLAIYKQLRFIQNKELGYKKEQVILVNDTYLLNDQSQSFKEEVKKLANVKQASYSGFLPVSGYNRNDNTYWREGVEPTEDNVVGTQIWSVDHDYVATYGMELISGRNFQEVKSSDSTGVIINETAFRLFGFTDFEADNYIQTNAFDPNTGQFSSTLFDKFKVLGVVKDFHFESLKSDIGPLALVLDRSSSVLAVKLKTDEMQSSIKEIESLWKKFGPTLPFNFTFLDAEYNSMYKAETQLGQVFTIFAVLAIFIGCLGLFALASFMSEQRAKEIGIRKVLGASVKGIVVMLSRQFSKLVIIAFILAVPLAWWGISQWLESYTYKITIGWGLFIWAGLAAFVIAWIAVAYHSIKVAISNPVKSLKTE